MRDMPKVRYRIIAQDRKKRLTVDILGEDLYFFSSAEHILNSPTLLNGFSKEEVEFIRYIASMEGE